MKRLPLLLLLLLTMTATTPSPAGRSRSSPRRGTPRPAGLTPGASPRPYDSPEVLQDSGDNGTSPSTPRVPPGAAINVPLANMRSFVNLARTQGDVDNTRKAYGPKENEYLAFCDHAYPSVPPSFRYTVDHDRLYRFLFYQAFRTKRSRKGVPRSVASSGFIASEYDSIVLKFTQYAETINNSLAAGQIPPESCELQFPADAVGPSTLGQYRAAVRNIYDNQYENNANSLVWESQIHLKDVKNLFKVVSQRIKVVKKLQHAEKIDSEDSPFQNFQEVPVIAKDYLLPGIGATCRTIFTSLRNRFAFLSNFSSILRNESQHLADLSDTRCFVIQRNEDHDPMLIKLMKIATGKTVKSDGPSQYGRATRHKDVFLCPIGAEAMYLFYRFEQSHEFWWDGDQDALAALGEDESIYGLDNFHAPEMRDNSQWFDMKLLVEHSSPDNTKILKQRCYCKSLDEIFKKYGITSNHFGHFGRVTAPLLCEFRDLPPNVIQELGK